MRWPWPRVAVGLAVEFLHRAPGEGRGHRPDVSRARPGRGLRLRRPERRMVGCGRATSTSRRRRARRETWCCSPTPSTRASPTCPSRTSRAAAWNGSPFHAGPLAEPRPLVLAPYQPLTDAAAALGHNFLVQDDDGTGAADVAVHRQRGQGAAVARRRGGAPRRRLSPAGRRSRRRDTAHRRSPSPARPSPRRRRTSSGRC